jgi:hypothetical protein
MKTEACGRSGLIYEPIAGKLLKEWAIELQLLMDDSSG